MIANSEFEAFVELDLAPVKIKLMHVSGEGWSPGRTAAVETEYRRFLYMVKAFPQDSHAPTDDVDTFWHYHILDTMKYAADCEKLFGHFLHHFPYAGMRGEADMETLQQVARRTAVQYERAFGARYPGAAGEATAQAACGIAEQAGLRLEIQPKVQANTSRPASRLNTGQALGAGTVEAAYCFVGAQAAGTRAVQAAYCFVDAPAARADTVEAAYCFTTAPAARAGSVEAAYCFTTSPAARAGSVEAAYCFTTSPAARTGTVEAAYCFTNSPAARTGTVEAAYCFTTVKAARSGSVDAAYCFTPAEPAAIGTVQAASAEARTTPAKRLALA
jgi:hypothetical protein